MKALGPLAQSAVRELASQELGGGINICHICLASRAELILASGDCAAQITDVAHRIVDRWSSGGKTWNSAFPFHAMPRQAVHAACGGVAIRNPLRIGPGATRKILAAWAAWKSRRRRRRGARGHATYAQSFAHRSWATQDPTARRPAIPSGRGTQRARHLATRNPLRIGPRDTQDRRSFLHAHFLLRAAGEQEENGPRSSARRPAKELAGRHAT